MENKIKDIYDGITMPESCIQKIETSFTGDTPVKKSVPLIRKFAAAAVCLIAVFALLCNPETVQALENAVAKVFEKTQQGDSVQYRTSDGKFTTTEKKDENGNMIASGSNNLMITPNWLLEKDGRLYFAGNNEMVDVTDLISCDTPYTYIYTDSGGFVHYICIGGTYDPDPEKNNVGYAEWFYDPADSDWIGGYADNNWDKTTNEDYPWLEKAKEVMGIPYP